MFERVTIGFGSEGMGYRELADARSRGRESDAQQPKSRRGRWSRWGRMLSALQQGPPRPRAGLSKITTVKREGRDLETRPTAPSGPTPCAKGVDDPFSYHGTRRSCRG